MKVIPCTDSAVQGNDFEFIPMIRMQRGHSVDASFSRHFSSIYIVTELSPDEVGSRSGGSGFLEKTTPLQEDFENFVPKGFTTSQIHVLCANFVKFGGLEIGKVVRYLPDKKTKTLASARITPKICQAQLQTIYCPRFHPNPFTSGGVIAKCVSVVQMRHKVFPILGEASASSPSKK